MNSKLITAVQALMDEHKLTARGWSVKAGLQPDAVRNILRGLSEHPRINTLRALAEAVGEHPDTLQGLVPPERPPATAEVVGAVAAGVFRDALEWDPDDRYQVPLIRDDRYPGVERFALEVRGPSMNLVYPHGSVVFCVKFFHIARDPIPGERVVVQRYAHDQVEATLKEFVVDQDKRRWLWPRSNDPQFQQPWPVPRRGEKVKEKLEIWALVVGSYKPE